jgi:type IV pilus assembly protein PilB
MYEPGTKIVTIEDPIEYAVGDIEQIQVNPRSGLTFANGLRSILRQDPNIIMVGEIRDGETAGLGVQAALTGHLVFSTLHTNNAAGVIPRLINLGVNPKILVSALSLSIAQRLVRKLCTFCKKEKISTEIDKITHQLISDGVVTNLDLEFDHLIKDRSGISGSGLAKTVAKQLNVPFSEFNWAPVAQQYFKSEGLQLVKTLTATDLKRLMPQIQRHFGLNEKTFQRNFAQDAFEPR